MRHNAAGIAIESLSGMRHALRLCIDPWSLGNSLIDSAVCSALGFLSVPSQDQLCQFRLSQTSGSWSPCTFHAPFHKLVAGALRQTLGPLSQSPPAQVCPPAHDTTGFETWKIRNSFGYGTRFPAIPSESCRVKVRHWQCREQESGMFQESKHLEGCCCVLGNLIEILRIPNSQSQGCQQRWCKAAMT